MVSIIVVTYNNLELTKKCIDSIFKHTRNFELIIIDNASTDGTVDYLKSIEGKKMTAPNTLESVRVIYNDTNIGYIKANNQGILLSQFRYICLLNNDTIVSHKWMLKLVRCMESHPAIGLVGPYTNYSAGHQRINAPYRNEQEFEKLTEDFSQPQREVDFLTGFCLLIKQEVIKSCGLLDDDFGMGNFEDNYLCWLALRAGYKIMIANCFVHHFGSASFKKDPKVYFELMARNQKLFYKKTGRELKISCIMPCADTEDPKHLQACLDTISPWVDEVCIHFNWRFFPRPAKITRLLGPYRDKVRYEYLRWRDDFSYARNRSKAMVSVDSEWIIWLDSDDIFLLPQTLREVVVANNEIGDYIFMNVFAPCEDGVETHLRHARIFRNKPEYYWQKPIHEDIVLSLKAANARMIHSDLSIRHIGYLSKGSTLKKNTRNLRIMKKYIKTNKDLDSLDYFHIANAYILVNTKESKLEAIKYLDQALAIPLPEEDLLWPKIVFLKARIYHDLGEFDSAKLYYQLSIDKRNYIESYLGMAEVMVAEKKIDAAIGYLEKMLSIGDKDGFEITSVPKNLKEMEEMMYYNLGYCYFHKEEYDKARDFFARTLQINSRNLKAMDFLCDILRRKGDYVNAFQATLMAVNLHPKYFHGWNNMGSFERMNKRYVTAELFYKKALVLYPDYDDAKKNLEALYKEWKR